MVNTKKNVSICSVTIALQPDRMDYFDHSLFFLLLEKILSYSMNGSL